jgi:hypothetical protein
MWSIVDRKVKLPRIWSNNELKKISSLFYGSVINVSGWKDIDKQGSTYREYFCNASEYWISNYVAEAKGFQGDISNEFFLDLETDIDEELIENFDVVFNHTVLEHIFDCRKAFKNICLLSRDIVIIIVPFMQHQHASYGDYWRFTPECIVHIFQKNGLEVLYINYNDGKNQSVYVFAVGSKKPQSWQKIRALQGNKIDRYTEKVGHKVVSQGVIYCIYIFFYKVLQNVKNLLK